MNTGLQADINTYQVTGAGGVMCGNRCITLFESRGVAVGEGGGNDARCLQWNSHHLVVHAAQIFVTAPRETELQVNKTTTTTTTT